MKLLSRALLTALVLTASSASAQTAIYRETFGRPTTATNITDLLGSQFDWPMFRPLAAPTDPALLQTVAGGTGGVSGNAGANGVPTDAVNLNAGTNSDGTTGAYVQSVAYMGNNESGPKLAWTPEFTFNPAVYTGLTFNWYQGNSAAADVVPPLHLAVRIGTQWYVNNTAHINTAVAGIAAFGAGAELKTQPYDPAAANWKTLAFDGTWDAATDTGIDSTVAFALGDAPAANLSGAITGFGLYAPLNTAVRRWDTFEIKGTLVGGGKPGDYSTDGKVDGEDFLRWQRGQSPTPGSATDLATWRTNFGTAVAASAPVPEPASAALALASAATLLATRRRGPSTRRNDRRF